MALSPASPPLVLARLLTGLIGGLVLAQLLEVVLTWPQTGLEDIPPLFWGVFGLAFSPLVFLPYWRYVGWLRAAAAQRATDTDRVRVRRWAAVWLVFTLAGAIGLLGSEVAARLRLGLWADEALAASWKGQPWWTLGFSAVGAVVSVGLLAELRGWVEAHSRTQGDPAAQARRLSPRLPVLTAWVRAGQLCLLVGLPLTLTQLAAAGDLGGWPGLLAAVLTTGLELLVLEYSLRFARASAAPPPGALPPGESAAG